jgi:hypothetical protein
VSDSAAEYLPRPGMFDPLAEGATDPEPDATPRQKPEHPSPKKDASLIQFYTPSQLRAYEPPPNQNMIGDYHLQRGAPSVLAGPPGCGKSRAAVWLGILGAQGAGNWFGMQIHCQFRTLILQNENGLSRLHRDMSQLPSIAGLDDWLKISAPPAYGLALQNPMFRAELKATMKDFAPNLLIVDPWNACVRDAMEKDFQEGFSRLREVLAESPNSPACLILHHLRKPKSEDRHKGRNLANLLSGSYVLVSVARSVIVMQPATDDVEDARVVMTCAKNNDGALGARTAWERKDGSLFVPVEGFNFEEYDSGTAKREPKVNEGHMRELFENGRCKMMLKQAAERLQEIAEVGRSAAYEALKLTGRFATLLTRDGDGLIGLRLSTGEETDSEE